MRQRVQVREQDGIEHDTIRQHALADNQPPPDKTLYCMCCPKKESEAFQCNSWVGKHQKRLELYWDRPGQAIGKNDLGEPLGNIGADCAEMAFEFRHPATAIGSGDMRRNGVRVSTLCTVAAKDEDRSYRVSGEISCSDLDYANKTKISHCGQHPGWMDTAAQWVKNTTGVDLSGANV